jgi:hypothetical protein
LQKIAIIILNGVNKLKKFSDRQLFSLNAYPLRKNIPSKKIFLIFPKNFFAFSRARFFAKFMMKSLTKRAPTLLGAPYFLKDVKWKY